MRLYQFIFGQFNIYSYTFFQEMQVAINLCYIMFVMYYLNTKSDYPKLHKALNYVAYFLIAVMVLDVIFLFSDQFMAHYHLLNVERLIMTLFGLAGMIYLLIKAKSKLVYFIVFGSLSYTLGALGLFFFSKLFYMITGSAIEIVIFSAGLTYKINLEYRERLQYQEEAFLNKTKALRAQINPHFIFNSLSSIQHLVTKNDRISAIKYLSKFSSLTRSILENSIESKTLLSDEIKMLENYLQLEALRFEEVFSYSITVDDSIDSNAIEIPSMLLQPFIENAIIHGLLPKQENDKNVAINMMLDNNVLICEIDDNGIGRTAASKRNYIHKGDKKSLGLEVTKLRLETLTGSKNNIQIIDKTDRNDNPLGTKVILKIPLENIAL